MSKEPANLTQWRDEARAVGRYDSEGQFTVDPRHAWSKLSGLIRDTEPNAYLTRVIQAAVRAATRALWTGALPIRFNEVPGFELSDLPGRLRLEAKYPLASPTALARALESGVPPSEPLLHHLWMAVVAACSEPRIRALEFVACDGQKRERLRIHPSETGGLPQFELATQADGSPPNWSWELLTGERPRGLSRLLARWKAPADSGLAPNVRMLQEVEFAAAPLVWRGDERNPRGLLTLIPRRACMSKGDPIWHTLAESYELAEPGDESVLTVGWESMHRSYQLRGVRTPEWYGSLQSKGMAPPQVAGPAPWRSVYCDLASFNGPEKTMVFACGCQFLCRRAVFLPLLSSPQDEAESGDDEGVLEVIQDGALLASYHLDLPYPGAQVFVTTQGLATDLSSGKVVHDEAWKRCVREVFEEVERLLERASQALAALRVQDLAAYTEVRELVQQRVAAAPGATRNRWWAVQARLFPD